MAKLFLALSHSTTGIAEVEAVTCCTTSSCLPGRARLVTIGFEAPGTKYPSEDGSPWRQGRSRHCQQPCGARRRISDAPATVKLLKEHIPRKVRRPAALVFGCAFFGRRYTAHGVEALHIANCG